MSCDDLINYYYNTFQHDFIKSYILCNEKSTYDLKNVSSSKNINCHLRVQHFIIEKPIYYNNCNIIDLNKFIQENKLKKMNTNKKDKIYFNKKGIITIEKEFILSEYNI